MYAYISFLFYILGNQGNKSSLNPKAPAFPTSGSHSSSTSTSYSSVVTGKPNNEKGNFYLV